MRLYRASKKNKKIKKEMNELNKKSKNKNGTLNKKRNNEEINHLGYLISYLLIYNKYQNSFYHYLILFTKNNTFKIIILFFVLKIRVNNIR